MSQNLYQTIRHSGLLVLFWFHAILVPNQTGFCRVVCRVAQQLLCPYDGMAHVGGCLAEAGGVAGDVVGPSGGTRKSKRSNYGTKESKYSYLRQRKNPNYEVQRGSVVKAAMFGHTARSQHP